MNKPRLRPGANDLKAFKTLYRMAFACDADAQQALAAFAHSLHATALAEVAIRVLPRDRKRGRPRQGAQPDQLVYQIEGVLASALVPREALVVQQRCFIRATNGLDDKP